PCSSFLCASLCLCASVVQGSRLDQHRLSLRANAPATQRKLVHGQIFLIWTVRPSLPSCRQHTEPSEDAMAKYLLVSFKTCPWVQRAAIVLREKKIDFEFQHIEPDNRPDWFLAISPHKNVPVL